jgi:hypothetical protein
MQWKSWNVQKLFLQNRKQNLGSYSVSCIGLVFLRLSGWKNSRSPQLTGNVDEREDRRRPGHGFAPTGCAVRMPSSCSSSSRPLRGRFARLDASARRWRLAGRVVLVTEAAPKGRFRAPKQHGCHLPRRRDAVTPKGPKRSGGSAQPIDGGSAAWPSLAPRLNQTAVDQLRKTRPIANAIRAKIYLSLRKRGAPLAMGMSPGGARASLA